MAEPARGDVRHPGTPAELLLGLTQDRVGQGVPKWVVNTVGQRVSHSVASASQPSRIARRRRTRPAAHEAGRQGTEVDGPIAGLGLEPVGDDQLAVHPVGTSLPFRRSASLAPWYPGDGRRRSTIWWRTSRKGRPTSRGRCWPLGHRRRAIAPDCLLPQPPSSAPRSPRCSPQIRHYR